jgi:hypothetical protein
MTSSNFNFQPSSTINSLTRGCVSRSKAQASAKQICASCQRVCCRHGQKSFFVGGIGNVLYQRVCTLLREAQPRVSVGIYTDVFVGGIGGVGKVGVPISIS